MYRSRAIQTMCKMLRWIPSRFHHRETFPDALSAQRADGVISLGDRGGIPNMRGENSPAISGHIDIRKLKRAEESARDCASYKRDCAYKPG